MNDGYGVVTSLVMYLMLGMAVLGVLSKLWEVAFPDPYSVCFDIGWDDCAHGQDFDFGSCDGRELLPGYTVSARGAYTDGYNSAKDSTRCGR